MNNKNSFNTTQNKNKKTKWTKYHTILFILIIIWSLGSVFGSIAFVKTAKADTLTDYYAFTTNDTFVYINRFYANGNVETLNNDSYLFRCTFMNSYQRDGHKFSFNIKAYNIDNSNYISSYNVSIPDTSGETEIVVTGGNGTTTDFIDLYFDDYYYDIDDNYVPSDYGIITWSVHINGLPNTATFLDCELSSSNFNCAVTHVVFSSEVVNNTTGYNIYTYYDTNNNYFRLKFPLSYRSYQADYFLLSERTYYFDNPLANDNVYQQGVADGKSEGFEDGYKAGLDNYDNELQQAFDNGKAVGKSEGYEDGINDANVYTFGNLFGSVVDAPLNAITSFLNFELLGYNMANFFWFIMTALIVLGVVRVIFGKG